MIGLFFFTLLSCDKDFENETTSDNKVTGFKIINYNDNSSKGVVNSILSFEDEDDYYHTLDSLDNEYETYSQSFTTIFAGLTDDEINDKIANERIDLEAPLSNFETFYNFRSLRNSIDEKENVWLQNPNPNFYECPQMHSISSFTERCLWNEKGEVMIDGKIYKYTEDNTEYIKIEDGSFAKLALINSGDSNIFNDPTISVVPIESQNTTSNATSSSSINCTSKSSNGQIISPSYTFQVVNGNRLKPRDWYFGKHSLSASTGTYRRRNTSQYYDKYITMIRVEIGGERYRDCGNSPTVVSGLDKTRYNRYLSVELKRDYKISTKYNGSFSSINSYHYTGWNGTVGPFPYTYSTLRLKY